MQCACVYYHMRVCFENFIESLPLCLRFDFKNFRIDPLIVLFADCIGVGVLNRIMEIMFLSEACSNFHNSQKMSGLKKQLTKIPTLNSFHSAFQWILVPITRL